MQYRIITGDWSDDGHGMTETFVVEVTSPHTLSHMQENYRKNCERWGYTLRQVCEEYEDSMAPDDLVDRMREDGAPSVVGTAGRLSPTPEGEELYVGEVALQFVMDFIGHGMPKYNGEDFAWHEATDNIPLLIGGYNAQIESSFGYGLHSH